MMACPACWIRRVVWGLPGRLTEALPLLCFMSGGAGIETFIVPRAGTGPNF